MLIIKDELNRTMISLMIFFAVMIGLILFTGEYVYGIEPVDGPANEQYDYDGEPHIYNNLTYIIEDNEVIIVKCNPNAENVVIPDIIKGIPVTGIDGYGIHWTDWAYQRCGAFEGCEHLISVTLPDTLQSIGSDAFTRCTALKDIYYSGSKEKWIEYMQVDIPFAGDVTVHLKNNETFLINPFSDIYETVDYYYAVLWAYYASPQITNGMDESHFGPQLTVTRGQAMTFLWRSQGCPEPSSLNNPFVDVPSTEYYYKPILWAVEQGITKGVDETHFNPMDTLSTQHMVTFLYRTKNPGHDGWSGSAAAWAADENDRPFGMDIAVDNTTPCPRCYVVQFLYTMRNGSLNEGTITDSW